MAILTHGSDLSLSPALGPLVRGAGQASGAVRAAVEQLARQGFASVQLDATLPGLRPRELSSRGRRDLLALLGRRNVRPSGLDLFIPRKHYADDAQMDRAVAATVAAIELARDLGRLPVSLGLPVKRLPEPVQTAIVEAADGQGVRLAVHAEDQLDALEQWVDAIGLPSVGVGLDPAALLARGHDPAAVAQRLGHRLAVARLSDVDRAADGDDDEEAGAGETVRCPAGAGELDLIPYRVAVDLAGRRAGPVVLDLRGLARPFDAAAVGKRAWDDAAFTV
ncbi:MAG: TIM barrel protein [Phycisphaeraceae bacterium]